MTFWEHVAITVIDKLLIGALLVVFGYWVKRRLERVKRDEQFRLQVALERMSAYRTLWSLTEPLSPAVQLDLSPDDRALHLAALRSWYHQAGNGMFGSWDASSRFVQVTHLLESGAPTPEVRKAVSALRTQLKVDMGVYDEEQAAKQLGLPSRADPVDAPDVVSATFGPVRDRPTC